MAAIGYTGGDPNKLDAAGYAQGDIPAADAVGTLQPVHIGTPGFVLTVNAGQPELVDWEAGGGGGGGVNSVFGRVGNVVATNGDYTKTQVGLGNVANALQLIAASNLADVANAATALANLGGAPAASPTFTGTVAAANVTTTGRTLVATDTLTDAATILVDAALGNQFEVTLNIAGATRVLGNPSNPPAAGQTQMILFAIRQDASGNRALTFGTAYRLGADISAITLSTGANKTDYLGVRWNGTDSKWDIVAFVRGY